MRQLAVTLGACRWSDHFVIFIGSFVTRFQRFPAQPQRATDVRRTLILAGSAWAIPAVVPLAVRDGNEARSSQGRAGFPVLRVGDQSPGAEFSTDAKDCPIERRVCVSCSVRACSADFKGFSAIVKHAGDRPTDDRHAY